MVLQLQDRVTVDNELATVRYVGTLAAWGPDEVAYGLEWDRPDRGKNNGAIDGHSYFSVAVRGSGSFLKASSKKIDGRRQTFAAALVATYLENLQFQHDIHFGAKTVEAYGFDKLNRLQSDFANLRTLSLQRKSIHATGSATAVETAAVAALAKVEHLDLSYNLLASFDLVWDILDQLPSVDSLVLNGNRFYTCTLRPPVYPRLKSLKLASTMISVDILNRVLTKFPNLSELYLAGNRYSDEDIRRLRISPTTVLFDLALNDLEVIPSTPDSVQTLILSDNRIAISSREVNTGLRALDIRHNSITDWAEIDAIAASFPYLRELRINGNDLFETMTIDEMTISLIARFECTDKKADSGLNKLNGTFLTKEEISNAELFFISKVHQNIYHYDQSSSRFKQLLRKHGIKSQNTMVAPPTSPLAKKKLTLNINTPNNQVTRVFLTDNTVLRLKGAVSKYINRSVLDFQVYYYVNEFEDTSIKLKLFLEDDSALLDSYGFLQNQNIYIC